MYVKTIICPVCESKDAEIGYDGESYLACHGCVNKDPIDVSELVEREFNISKLCQVCKNMNESGCKRPTCSPQSGYPSWTQKQIASDSYARDAWQQAYAKLYQLNWPHGGLEEFKDKARLDYLDDLPVNTLEKKHSDSGGCWWPWTHKISCRGETPQFQTIREVIDYGMDQR